MSNTSGAVCAGCGADGPQLQCPKCKELGLPLTLFCGQPCFQKNWKTHKAVHSQPPPASIMTMSATERAIFNFPGSLRPGLITPRRKVPAAIKRPDYADQPDGRSACEENERSTRVPRWAGEDLEKIKLVCKLSREVTDIGAAAVKPGVTTDEIDRVIHEATIERGMYPSPLNYYNFPKSCCTSVNEIICHGIPDNRELEAGDIVNLDISSYLGDMHGDLNETVFVGKPDDETINVVHCAYECLQLGISRVAPGNMYKHIGDGIEARAAQSNCSVVRSYSGHGIGTKFHTVPNIPHYGNNKAVGVMAQGHVFTIEPMINVGTWRDVTWPDNWTSSTADGKRSAQFEHTMMVTDGGVELLTDWKDSIPTYQKQLSEWGMEIPPLPNPEGKPVADKE